MEESIQHQWPDSEEEEFRGGLSPARDDEVGKLGAKPTG